MPIDRDIKRRLCPECRRVMRSDWRTFNKHWQECIKISWVLSFLKRWDPTFTGPKTGPNAARS